MRSKVKKEPMFTSSCLTTDVIVSAIAILSNNNPLNNNQNN